MTWHQWHQTAPISRRMGLSSDLARSNAASPHSCQSMGWWAAERRYGLAESFRRFSGWSVKVAHNLSRRRTNIEVLRFAQDDMAHQFCSAEEPAPENKIKSPG